MRSDQGKNIGLKGYLEVIQRSAAGQTEVKLLSVRGHILVSAKIRKELGTDKRLVLSTR
jgi:hypothetical protein